MDEVENHNTDFMDPEVGTDESAVAFHAPSQQEKFLAGSSSEGKKTWENGLRKTIEVNGTTWHYIESGNPQGQPVLNIHGWLGSSAEGNEALARALAGEHTNDSKGIEELAQTDPQTAEKYREGVKALEGKYHVITPELPGFGETETVPGKVMLDRLADELSDFQKATDTKGGLVFGSSMGGILATKMEARHPGSAKALVLQGTMTQPTDMDKVAYIAAQVATWGPVRGILEKMGLSNKLFAAIVKGSKDYKIADSTTQERILAATLQADPKTAATTLREIGHDIGKDISTIQCPVVVIDGANGDLVPIAKSSDVANRFHPEISQGSEKVAEKKVVFLPLGGRVGEQGHNVINTLPEGVATWIDYVNDRLPQAV